MSVREFQGDRVFVGKTQKMRGSDEFEAVKSAAHLFAVRYQLAGIDHESHDFVKGGTDAVRAGCLEQLGGDPEPIHSYWGRFIDALITLDAAIKRGQVPTGGLLDLLDDKPTDS